MIPHGASDLGVLGALGGIRTPNLLIRSQKAWAHVLEEQPPGVADSALGGIRTPNLLIRSQVLYPLSYERRLEPTA